MIQAVKRLPTSPTQKLLLLVLADCHNEKTGQCNPSYRYIMDITGLSNKAVANNLKDLRNSGSVTFCSKNGANTHYELTPERYILSGKPVNDVHNFGEESSEPSSQVEGETSEPDSAKAVNLVPKSSEPSSHKPVLEPEHKPICAKKEKPKREKKPKKESDPRHPEFVRAFFDTFHRQFGSKLQLGSKDFKQLSSFLKTFPDITIEEWQAAINWCYEVRQSDRYARGPVHNVSNLAAFCVNWSSLVAYHQIYRPSK